MKKYIPMCQIHEVGIGHLGSLFSMVLASIGGTASVIIGLNRKNLLKNGRQSADI